MPFNPLIFEQQLTAALNLFDNAAATTLCEQFINYLYDAQPEPPPETLERILQLLRNKRMYPLMQRVGDACIELGLQSYKIRRQYAQSLIDQGIYAGALSILQELRSETRPDTDPSGAGEHAEATGLIGRVYKQQYANAHRPEHPRMVGLLKQAIQHYAEAYTTDPVTHRWHGINLVALLCRANRDGIGLKGLPDPSTVAEEILKMIRGLYSKGEASLFDLGTACEACIALEQPDDALVWVGRYASSAADAFELASTLRQLQEVWQLTTNDPVGKLILPPLNAALLKRQGSAVTIAQPELARQELPGADKHLEKLLGATSFKTYQWYLRGLKACTAVARIGRDRTQGFGTGFLLDGGLLTPELDGRILLFTNAHVISNDPAKNKNSFYPDQVVAILESIDSQLELRFEKIIYSSPVTELDTTILSFDAASEAKLSALRADICVFSLAKRVPLADGLQRVYIIGHPNGGTLSISLQDNVLLAQDGRLMHYRTPTTGGSSGSPVFNDEWELLGIHHAGSNRMRPLDGSLQFYAANEGILLDAIKAGLAMQPMSADAK